MMAVPANWEQIVIEQFPQSAWLLTDIDRTKYADTFDILKQAIEEEWYASDTGLARFQSAISGSSFFKQLRTERIDQQLMDAVGTINFSGNNYGRLVARIINYGLTGDDLKREAYREAFRKDENGNYANERAAQNVRNSTTYKAYVDYGKTYFINMSDRLIEQALTGRVSTQDVDAKVLEIAKSRYQHLAPMLDKGLSMQEITQNYRDYAAQLLEVDPNTIDMSKANYERAYMFDENGTKRMMTNGEWEQTLKTDKRYGWTKTNNAKDEARQLGNTLAKAFGRLM
jgi:hypothetical protein